MSTKRKLRSVLDRSALYAGVTHWCEARMQRGFTALMYHRVLPDKEALRYPFRSLAMPESAFALQVRWLAEHFTVLPLSECIANHQAGARYGRPLVAVTFDDGYRDNAAIAAPLLEEFGLRGTFYATSEFLRTGEPLWFDRFAAAFAVLDSKSLNSIVSESTGASSPGFASLAEWMSFAKERTAEERESLLTRLASADTSNVDCLPMSVEQLRALHARGHEIGAHTRTHPLLPDCDDVTLDSELRDSKRELESWLDAEVTGLAYPNGNHDERVRAATRAAGYEYACTTESGINLTQTDPFTLTRLDVTRDRVFDVNGRFDNLAFRSEVCRVRRFMRAS